MNPALSPTSTRYAQRKTPPGARLRVAARLLCVYGVCVLLGAAMLQRHDLSIFVLTGIIPDLFRAGATPDALAGWAYVTLMLFAPVTFALCQPQSRAARWLATAAIVGWCFFNLAFAGIGV